MSHIQTIQAELRQLVHRDPNDVELFLDTLPEKTRTELLNHVRSGIEGHLQEDSLAEDLVSTLEIVRALLLNHSLRDETLLALFQRILVEGCSSKERNVLVTELEQGFISVLRDSKLSVNEKFQEIEGIWLRIEALLPAFDSSTRARVVDVLVSISKSAIQIDKSRGQTLSTRIARFMVDYIFDPESCSLVLSVINDLHLDQDLSQILRRKTIHLIEYLDSSQCLPFMKGLFEIIRSLLKETNDKLFPWIEVFRIFTYSAPLSVFRDILCLLDIEISNIPSIGMVIQRYYETFAVSDDFLAAFRMQDLATLILIFSIHENMKNNIANTLDALSERPVKIQISTESEIEDTFCALFTELINFQDTEYLLVYILELCYHWLSDEKCCAISIKQKATTIIVNIFQRQPCSRGEIAHYIFFEMAEPSHSTSYRLHLCDIIERLIGTNIIDLASFVPKIQDALQFLESLPVVVCKRFLKMLCRLAGVSHSFTDFLMKFLQQKAFGRYIGGQCLGALGFIAVLSERSLQRVHSDAMNILQSLATRSSYGVRLVIYEGWRQLAISAVESRDSIMISTMQKFLLSRLEELAIDWKNGQFSLKESFDYETTSNSCISYPKEPIAHLLHCLWTIDSEHPSLGKCFEWFCSLFSLMNCIFPTPALNNDGDIASAVCLVKALHNVGDVLLQFFDDTCNRAKLIRSLTVLYELEDFMVSRSSGTLEIDPIAVGVSASNVLVEKEVIRDISLLEQCHNFEMLFKFVSWSLDNVNALYIFLRKLSGYASTDIHQENASYLGNLTLQLISYSRRLEDSKLSKSDLSAIQWTGMEWWESFRQRYSSVSPRQMCLFYILTILDTLCSKGLFVFDRDVYPETLDQLEQSFMDDESKTAAHEHKVMMSLWNFFETEFARTTGIPIIHAQLHLQLILRGLSQVENNTEQSNHFSIARKVVRLLDQYSIQQTSILRLLIRILIKCCNNSKLIFSLLHHLACTCRTKPTPKSSENFAKKRVDEEMARYQEKQAISTSSNQNLMSPSLSVLLQTNMISPPESESGRTAVLIVVLQHLETRYNCVPTKKLPIQESLDEVVNILMIIHTILVGEEISEMKDEQLPDSCNFPPNFVNRSMQLTSRISKTAFQWMNRSRKNISAWKKDELYIKSLATFAENIATRLQTITRWIWKGRSKPHFRTTRSPALPRIQYHFAKLQVESSKILHLLDKEMRPLFQKVVQDFQGFHHATEADKESLAFDQPVQPIRSQLSRKVHRKKFRSRNRFIDACLVEEESDGDDYADLEDFLVVDKELEGNGKQPVQIVDWMKRIFPQYQ
ncbi:hypothetical protein GpartN1_g5961.t1 [Galdieria partita]|uniref:Uncharacterized protein n=1 Tax=Galdieria partita TaxID=83374 RepID=A0A9C7UT69_9RHOD|nr:hypothetical protein GpartN1_g5961.t1 [Galdieria partita]